MARHLSAAVSCHRVMRKWLRGAPWISSGKIESRTSRSSFCSSTPMTIWRGRSEVCVEAMLGGEKWPAWPHQTKRPSSRNRRETPSRQSIILFPRFLHLHSIALGNRYIRSSATLTRSTSSSQATVTMDRHTKDTRSPSISFEIFSSETTWSTMLLQVR